MAGESSVLPSATTPKSLTFTSFACAMAAVSSRIDTIGLLRFGDFEDGTVELLAARRGEAVAHERVATDRSLISDVRRAGDVQFADAIFTFGVKPPRLHGFGVGV